MTDRVEQVDGEQVVVKDKEFETACPKCGCTILGCTRKMEAQWVEVSRVVDGEQDCVRQEAIRSHSNGTRFHCLNDQCYHSFNLKWEPRA